MKLGNSSVLFNSVYLDDSYTVAGPMEKEGPLKDFFNVTNTDMYMNCDSWEKAEQKMLFDTIAFLQKKHQIDYVISGDLLNQEVISNYVMREFDIPYIGIYGACSTAILGVLMAGNMLEANNGKYIICATSSHNSTSERQFRNPTEYGGFKPQSSTYTVTGASGVIACKKGGIKVKGGTFGRVIDASLKDPNDLGSAMAPAAYETLMAHLQDFNIKPDYYDLILTGDLSKIGADIFKELCKIQGYRLENYNDCGLMIYDRNSQEVFAGGSGCACIGLVAFSYIKKLMDDRILKKVLLIGTGALLNPSILNQKETIPSIAHAIALEVE